MCVGGGGCVCVCVTHCISKIVNQVDTIKNGKFIFSPKKKK